MSGRRLDEERVTLVVIHADGQETREEHLYPYIAEAAKATLDKHRPAWYRSSRIERSPAG